MSKWIYDIETDNLLLECTRMWVLSAKNLDTKEQLHFLEGDFGWMKLFEDAELIIGHNILGFDNSALLKLFNFKFPKSCRFHDTMIMSLCLDYKRFGSEGHSLDTWGEHLGVHKIKWRARCIELGIIKASDPSGAEFRQFHPEMVDYCRQDVVVNEAIYEVLINEFRVQVSKYPNFKHYIRAEHAVSQWSASCNLQGWPFDVAGAITLKGQLEDKIQEAYLALQPRLGFRCVAVDKCRDVVDVKSPKWTKEGLYATNICKWFGIDPYSGLDDPELNDSPGHRPIKGDFCRIEIKPLSIDSSDDVKLFLKRHGWIPTEWNYKKGTKIKASPKITEDSLEFLGGEGALYTAFRTAKSRLAILKGWIEHVDENGRLHGDCFTIGTPSMRMRHSVIANIPSGELKKDGTAVSAWGPEMRRLFTTLPGWSLVGCDSAGNQARGLAHYLRDQNFIEILLNGDIHQYNADKLTEVLRDMGIDHIVPRSNAKRILYAFLFGAAGAKLWSYIFGTFDSKQGNKLKEGFLEAVPGFSTLIATLTKQFKTTKKVGEGYILSIVGTKVYVDSLHKLLVYLLQSLEKITCSTALMLTAEQLDKENIPYIPLIFYHDEIDFMVPNEFAERAAKIGKSSFKIGPELYDIVIMDGSGKIGKDWQEIH